MVRGTRKHVGNYSMEGEQLFGVAVGSGTASDMTLTGLETTDRIYMIFQQSSASATAITVVSPSEAAITAANTFQLSTTATDGDTLLIGYYREGPYLD